MGSWEAEARVFVKPTKGRTQLPGARSARRGALGALGPVPACKACKVAGLWGCLQQVCSTRTGRTNRQTSKSARGGSFAASSMPSAARPGCGRPPRRSAPSLASPPLRGRSIARVWCQMPAQGPHHPMSMCKSSAATARGHSFNGVRWPLHAPSDLAGSGWSDPECASDNLPRPARAECTDLHTNVPHCGANSGPAGGPRATGNPTGIPPLVSSVCAFGAVVHPRGLHHAPAAACGCCTQARQARLGHRRRRAPAQLAAARRRSPHMISGTMRGGAIVLASALSRLHCGASRQAAGAP